MCALGDGRALKRIGSVDSDVARVFSVGHPMHVAIAELHGNRAADRADASGAAGTPVKVSIRGSWNPPT
jgi:hypothetical protein